VLGDRVVYESTGRAADGASTYALATIGPGGRRSALVAAPTAVIRTDGVAHATSYAYAASRTHLALAELDRSTRGSSSLGSVTLSFSALNGKATETIASCEQPDAPRAPPFAVDATRIAFVAGACEGAPETLVIHEQHVGDVRIAVPAGDTVTAVALAGDYVAYDLESAAPPRILVAARATGAEVFHVDGTGGPFALQADGTLAAVGGACPGTTLLTASPAAPAPSIVADAHPCSPVRLAGGHVVYRSADAQLHVADVGGTDRTLIETAVGDFDADAQHAVYTLPDCAGRALYRAPLGDFPTRPAPVGSCPLRVRKRSLRLHGTHVIVPLSCPHACRGQLELRRGATLARTPFAVDDPGTGSVTLRLGARARRLRRGTSGATLTVRTTLPSGRSSTSRVALTVRR
jgi:hypothetical protein